MAKRRRIVAGMHEPHLTFRAEIVDYRGQPMFPKKRNVLLVDASGRRVRERPEAKVLLNASGEPVRRRIGIPSPAVVRALSARHSRRIVAAQSKILSKALKEAHKAFLQLMDLRNWQAEKALRIISQTALFREKMKSVETGIGFERMKVKEIRHIFADWIIEEYLKVKERRKALEAALARDADKIAKGTKRIVVP